MRGVPPVGGGFALASGPLGRARDAALVALTDRVFARGLPALNASRAQHGLPPVSAFYDQVLTADRILVLTSPTFDYAARYAPANARFRVPVLDDPERAQPGTPLTTGDPRPLVLVVSSH